MADGTGRHEADILERDARRRLNRKLAATRAAIALERLIPLIWPPLAVLLAAVGLSASGLLDSLPGWLHLVVLLSGAGLVFALIFRGALRFRLPGSGDAARRLEADELLHRPLTAMNDRLALGGGDTDAESLWQAHRRRMAARIEALRAPSPQPDMPRRDPLALRFAAVMLLVLGLAFGSGDLGGNLLAAVSPSLDTGSDEPVTLEAWITPPAYTGRPPVFMAVDQEGGPRPLTVPVNSKLLARFHGPGDATLSIGEAETPFERVTERDQQLEKPITEGGLMRIARDGDAMGAWQVKVIPDNAPAVEITEAPSSTLRGALRIAYAATDDYGLTLVAARIRRDGADDETRLELPLPGSRRTTISDVVFRDLTDHRWAGLEVELSLEVRDEAGQTGVSEPVRMILPERDFSQPAARAVVEQRRKLIADADANRSWVVRAIEALQINPGTYNDDLAAHLMLSLARAELRDSGSAETVSRNEELLWRTALRIEEGQLSVALNKLREIQEKLMEALANGASEEEIQKLMDELQQAMNDYLQAMQQQAMDRLQNGEMSEQQSEQGQQIEQRALSDLLDKARELSRSGARDKAREMLSQLQNMLENLQMGTQSQAAQAEQQADQMLDELGRMMQQQQQLMDETFRRQQQQQRPESRPPSQRDPFSSPRRNRFGRSPNTDTENPSRGGQPGEMSDEDLASAQERLRRRLNDLLQQLGENGNEIPGELGEAEGSMRDAEGALGEGNRQSALGSQSEALDQLRRGTEFVMEDMASRGQNQGQSNEGSSQAGMDGQDTDPLGRTPTETWGDASEDLVPGESALQRSREILDELRRRSGQRHRSIMELDYIERLLKQF
ncbi:MAG: TIGR02302 family protein [Minwuia sp.]|uniref:TIGR02302 family protein n=1 Tax=Minwuia sp. TaxID=2493630 RepID=UPI003A883A61